MEWKVPEASRSFGQNSQCKGPCETGKVTLLVDLGKQVYFVFGACQSKPPLPTEECRRGAPAGLSKADGGGGPTLVYKEGSEVSHFTKNH